MRKAQPIVLALNTQSAIDSSLINLRIACHPVRLLADAEAYSDLPQPLITPASMLQKQLLDELDGTDLLDFGLGVEPGEFQFHDTYCIAPTSLVLAYSLSVVTSGKAANILMAGFDGYPPGDPRNAETATLLTQYKNSIGVDKLISVTPTVHKICSSIYSPKSVIFELEVYNFITAFLPCRQRACTESIRPFHLQAWIN